MPPLRTKDRYAVVLDWAARHFGVVSRAELTALGIPPGTVAAWIANGRLQRLRHGVYAVGHTARRAEGRWRVAVLGCGRRAALSHHTALLALGLWAPEAAELHVTTAGAARSRPGIRVHRSPMAPVDLTTRFGLPVTRVERALVDLADVLPWPDLVGVADRLWVVDLAALRAARERAGHRAGWRRSGLLLAREEPRTRSELEREFLRFLRRSGLPRPSALNRRVGRFVVDAVYDEPRLAVELHGRAYHARRREMAADRRRDADLQALGYRVLRLVWEDLLPEQAAAAAARLTRLLALRGA